MKKNLLVLVVVLVLSSVLAACGGGSQSGSTNIESKMSDFVFEPKEWTVPAGKEITITLTNDGAVLHEWVLMSKAVTVPFDEDDEGNVTWEAEVDAGAKQTFTFTAPSTPGEYLIVCGIPGHLEAGMEGKLKVVAP